MSSAEPDYGTYELPVGPFTWRDRSGHEVVTRRSDDHYLTNGDFVERARTHLPHFDPEPVSMILWGIGNHGGGPSREEYRSIRSTGANIPEYEFIESTNRSLLRRCARADGSSARRDGRDPEQLPWVLHLDEPGEARSPRGGEPYGVDGAPGDAGAGGVQSLRQVGR